MKIFDSVYPSNNIQSAYTPIFFRLSNEADKSVLNELFKENKISIVRNEIYGQLQELVKCLNPSIKIKEEEYPALIEQHLAGQNIDEYGVWVYYPWSHQLVHTLDEQEFVEVRTNRNRYKITREEQALLQSKKVGIIGLSVGQSIALTMAIERICGEIRLADFDTAELSNLNRIRTGIHNLGLKKTVIAAREIMEIDPFIKVRLFNEGIDNGNINDFFLGEGKLDLLVEVCDGLDIKILSRFKAKELSIPVVMDTNDRGMLDIERFDLDPERPILHGLAEGLNPDNIKNLTNEEKVPYILKMIGAETLSTRLKSSMIEVEQSINTWPQLASSVTLGGALTTDVVRRILLSQLHISGRFYVDLEELIRDEENETKTAAVQNPYTALTTEQIQKTVASYFSRGLHGESKISADQLEKIINAAIIAPSAGNNQPWKWAFKDDVLFLFHDKYKSYSWGDYFEMGSHMSLGTAIENTRIQAADLNINANINLFPLETEPCLIASITFAPMPKPEDNSLKALAPGLFTRHTNRKLGVRKPLPASFFEDFESLIASTGINLHVIDKENELTELADIIAECDKVRLLNELGHEEFFHEIRWNEDDAKKTKDGIELRAVDLSMSEMAGFRVAQDWKAIALLSEKDLGNAFKKLSLKAVNSASAMVLFTIKDFTAPELVKVGQSVQKTWIYSNLQGVSVHPMLSPAFFFNRLIHGNSEELTAAEAERLSNLRSRFLKIIPLKENEKEVFLMKLSIADEMGVQSLRRNKDDVFIDLNQR